MLVDEFAKAKWKGAANPVRITLLEEGNEALLWQTFGLVERPEISEQGVSPSHCKMQLTGKASWTGTR